MFEQLRDALRDLGRPTDPADRRASLAAMRDALVHARLALQDLRDAIAVTERRLATEQGELATATRRRALAAQIDDAETVAIADRFVAQHSERVRVLEQKRAAQLDELALGEREYDEMSRDLKRAMAGLPLGSANAPEAAAMHEVEEFLGDRQRSAEAAELEAMARQASRAQREAEAAERLAALKRQLGKEP
jgi:hypothetical protein